MASPIISACICTHDGATRLGESLWSLVCQSAPAERYEILVVDNASSDADETRALVRSLIEQGHDIALVHEPQLGLAHAKNRAVRQARGDYVYFLDDDAIANPRLIESYLQAILEHKPDVMGGHVHPQFDRLPPLEMDYSQWFMWSLRHFGPQDRWLGEGEYFLGGNLCVSRAVLEGHPHDGDLGRKGDELRGGEEWYLGASEFRRRLVTGGFIFHRVPEERTGMDYVQRVMCGPVERLAQSSTANGEARRGGYLLSAWAREIALSFRRIAFQVRLALASRKPTSAASTGHFGSDAQSDPVLDLLRRENPLFQLQTGNSELPSSEKLFAENGGSDTRRFARASAALPPDSLAAVYRLLAPEQTTIEIGGGHSTVAFASVVARHICVNPDRTANELVRGFLEEHELWRDNVEFLGESSAAALPGLEIPGGLDVALMDGNHSFPFPMLDWHFIDRHLHRGSFLVIDNVEINAVRMLTEYLDREPAYRLVERVRGSHRYDCYIYEKIRDRVVSGWNDQEINRTTLMTLCLDATVTALWKPLQRIKRRALRR
ncbi:MAG: glycosyltransferase [Deltaproteobacteria bacterium]|nr:glycosyltransferase [Deltaproteobacteria bacterium]MBW2725559.1 glycosyltransferase [Deltaproteobacteria bacterium]